MAKKVALFNFFGVIGFFKKDDGKKCKIQHFLSKKKNLPPQIIEHMWLKIISKKLFFVKTNYQIQQKCKYFMCPTNIGKIYPYNI